MKREAIQCAPLALIVGGLVWGVVASNAQADTIDWDGNNAVPPSGYYNVAANWNPDKIPGAADNARFINNPYAYDVFFDKSQEVWDLAFQDPMTSFLSYGSKRHYAMNDDAWIMAGWLNLIGLDFTVTDNMRIDAATMTIQDGDYGSCSVTLNDLEVAYEDVGVLLVYGGDITSNSLWISYEFGSAGTVLIDGSDTTWTVNGPVEGGFIEGGSASLTISNGAELSCTGSTFSGVSDTGVTVDGPGTTWDIAGELNMGVYYRGNLTITDGAAVTSQTAKIGLYWVPIYSGWGVVDVGGSGADASWTNTGSVYVAGRDAVGGGHGELNLKTGSLVNIGGTLKVWGTGTAHTEGSVTMCSGSTLIADVIDLDTGADFYTGTDSRLCVNGLTGFGDSCTFLSTLEIGHAGGSGSGSLTIGDGQYCTVEDDLTVGLDAPGEVLVCEGGNLTNDACKVGQEVDAIGTVTVEDSGAQWYNDQWVIAGVNGHGTIDIVSGGYVYSHEVSIGYGAGSVGVANVKWYGSTWTCLGNFYVGRNGQGTLSILGGKVEDVNGRMGWGASATAHATVSGGLAEWIHSDDLCVASAGQATLEILDGGEVSSNNGYVGHDSTSVGTVTIGGDSARWIVNNDLVIGRAGSASLTINNNGGFHCVKGIFAMYAGSDAAVLIQGDSTGCGADFLYLGGDETTAGGVCDFTLTDGADLTVSDTIKIWDDASFTMDDECQLVVDTINDSSGGSFQVFGGKLIFATYIGDLTLSGGVIAPGYSPAVSDITGDYTQAAGTYEVEIAGTGYGNYDRLEIGGNADLAGDLQVELLADFTPGYDDTFTILIANNVSGFFANAPTIVNVVGGGTFEVIYSASSVALTHYLDDCPEDVNDDWVVDIDDLFLVLGHWGEGPGQYDVNDDGTVDIDDIFAILGNWGPCP